MKRFLVILSLILALCMLTALALADDDDDDSNFGGISYEEALRIHEIDGHNVSNPRIQRESTCKERGIIRFDCDTDPSHFHEVYMPLGDHQWKISTSTANCTQGGTVTKVCKVCGEKKTETTPALGHIWSSEYNDPNGNWTDADKQTYSPKDYDLSSSMPNDFSWGRVTKDNEPTCTEPGTAIDFCPRCGATREKTRTIDPLGHKWVAIDPLVEDPNCLEPGLKTYRRMCERCGLIEIDETKGDNGYEEIPVPQPAPYEYHDWDEWIVVKEPTCFEDGQKLHWCKRCGDKQELPIDKLEPEWATRDSRLINCYREERTYYCVNCDGKAPGHEDWSEEREVVAHTFIHDTDGAAYVAQYKAGGEKWDAFLKSLNYVVADRCVKPTCDTEGKLVFKCIYDGVAHFNCDHVEGQNYEYHEVVLPALGHDFNAWELRYAPNYQGNENAYGYWLRDCNRCGRVEERISYFAPEDTCTEHQFEDINEYKAPTCTEDGYQAEQCQVCGFINRKPIPALGHDWDVRVFDATCTEAGKEIKVCLTCGALETNVIDAKGHTEQAVAGYPATCVEAGLTDGVVCSVCGTVLVEQEVIPCRGYHIYVDIPAVAPTCTEVGYTSGGVCECGAKIGQDEIPATGHNYEAAVVAPTCTEEGYTLYTCANCGDTYTEDTVAALGHTWNAGKVVSEPTYDNGGEILYTCTVCGATKTEETDPVARPAAAYKMGEIKANGGSISVEVNHVPDTEEVAALFARVTMIIDGRFISYSQPVIDGMVNIYVEGEVEAVSIEITGSSNIVPGTYVSFDGGYYWF